ncbi:GxxExxY protein [Patescibacteria group bacterium]|nr:GxxExxY protein [Patescibacteria group bacterium]MBU1673972.1 GxxExxY protein [Patescibacteria group bacterium]MBU1962954.1 GxxExxY protein [Patescibacteria group bacterium]
MTEIIFPELSYLVQGVYYDVYNKIGPGHKEEIYQKAMAIGLNKKKINFVLEKPLDMLYKGHKIGFCRPDIVVQDKIILELKARDEIHPINIAQLISYLKVTDYSLGILMNFGSEKAQYERVINNLKLKNKNFKPKNEITIKPDLLYPGLSKDVLDCLLIVHSILGPGFFHYVYRRALWIELRNNGIPFLYKKKKSMSFKGEILGESDVKLFFIENKILVRVLAVKEISEIEIEKMKKNLKYFNIKLGLIANFNRTRLNWNFIRN